jgi:hypothetical protein
MRFLVEKRYAYLDRIVQVKRLIVSRPFVVSYFSIMDPNQASIINSNDFGTTIHVRADNLFFSMKIF